MTLKEFRRDILFYRKEKNLFTKKKTCTYFYCGSSWSICEKHEQLLTFHSLSKLCFQRTYKVNLPWLVRKVFIFFYCYFTRIEFKRIVSFSSNLLLYSKKKI